MLSTKKNNILYYKINGLLLCEKIGRKLLDIFFGVQSLYLKFIDFLLENFGIGMLKDYNNYVFIVLLL